MFTPFSPKKSLSPCKAFVNRLVTPRHKPFQLILDSPLRNASPICLKSSFPSAPEKPLSSPIALPLRAENLKCVISEIIVLPTFPQSIVPTAFVSASKIPDKNREAVSENIAAFSGDRIPLIRLPAAVPKFEKLNLRTSVRANVRAVPMPLAMPLPTCSQLIPLIAPLRKPAMLLPHFLAVDLILPQLILLSAEFIFSPNSLPTASKS